MLAGDDDDDEDDALFWQQQYQRSQHKDRRQLQAEIEPLLDDGQVSNVSVYVLAGWSVNCRVTVKNWSLKKAVTDRRVFPTN